MSGRYIAAPFQGSGPGNWLVFYGWDGRIVERGLSRSRAVTLARTLNLAAEAERRLEQPPKRRPPQARRD